MKKKPKHSDLRVIMYSVFTAKMDPYESQALETRETSWRKEDLLGWGTSDQSLLGKTWQFTNSLAPTRSTCAERTGRSDCQTTLYHLWQITKNRRGAWGVEERQYQYSLQKGKEEGSRKVQARKPDLHPWKSDKTTYSEYHLKANERKKKIIMSS